MIGSVVLVWEKLEFKAGQSNALLFVFSSSLHFGWSRSQTGLGRNALPKAGANLLRSRPAGPNTSDRNQLERADCTFFRHPLLIQAET